MGKRGRVATAAAMALAVLALYLWQPDSRRRATQDPRDVPDAGFASERAHNPVGVGSSTRPAAPEPAAGDRLLFRNLADGQPVPGLQVFARVAPDRVADKTDESGRVSFPAKGTTEITVDNMWWAVAPSSINKPNETGVCWVHGWIELDGIVVAGVNTTAFHPEEAVLYTLVDSHNAPENLPDTGALGKWLRREYRLGRPSRDGRFGGRVPRAFGVTIATTATGWQSARHTIDVSRAVEREHVELRLERALRIRGVARSSDGTILENLPVCCISLLSLSATEASSEKMRLLMPNGGYTSIASQRTGRARVKFMTLARTDKNGRFDLPVPIEGEVLVIAHPFGHRPAIADLGASGNHDADNLDLVAERVREPSRVRVVANGKPIDKEQLLISDMSLKEGHAQPAVYVDLDRNGSISSDWLVPDQRYCFSIGAFHGHLIWDGRDTLDVAKDLRPNSELPSR